MVTCATTHDLAPGHLARRQDRLAHFVEVAESFENQQVDAGFHQRLDLLAKTPRASANEVGPSGSMRTPSGPTAPATNGALRRPLRGPAGRPRG